MSASISPDMIRIGAVSECDLATGTVRVRVGEIETAPIPWGTMRAGNLRIWSPPSEGEQVILWLPEGDWESAFILGALFSGQRPEPSVGPETLMLFDDGARFSYDMESSTLSIDLSDAGGQARVVAPSGIEIEADVQVTGKVTVSEDVIAGGVSLVDHKHTGVAAGSGLTGVPE
tara:strand:- start:185 stop:706 length:522 start_codon:yes stop_codon:yes gene_type:complete